MVSRRVKQLILGSEDADENGAVFGDFCVLEAERACVLKSLRAADFNMVAIRHHMTMEELGQPTHTIPPPAVKGRFDHFACDVPRRHLIVASYPSSRAESAGKATHTTVTMPAMSNCFLPGAFTAFTKSSLSQALTLPGRSMYGASGKSSFNSGTSGPFGPSSKLVVRIVGS
jgi:hypothetical protein